MSIFSAVLFRLWTFLHRCSFVFFIIYSCRSLPSYSDLVEILRKLLKLIENSTHRWYKRRRNVIKTSNNFDYFSRKHRSLKFQFSIEHSLSPPLRILWFFFFFFTKCCIKHHNWQTSGPSKTAATYSAHGPLHHFFSHPIIF